MLQKSRIAPVSLLALVLLVGHWGVGLSHPEPVGDTSRRCDCQGPDGTGWIIENNECVIGSCWVPVD